MAIVLVAAVSMTGCTMFGGSGDDATPTPVTGPIVLDAAGARFADTNSGRFTLTIDGDAALDESSNLLLRGAEGSILRPDRADVQAQIALSAATLSVHLIAIGEDQYMTNFLTGDWERAPEGLNYNPAVLFDDEPGIAGVLRNVDDAQLTGSEDLDGTEAYHVTGSVARDAVQAMAGNAFKSDRINFDIWINRSTNDILRIVLNDPQSAGGARPVTWTLTITVHDKPVTIEAPPLS